MIDEETGYILDLGVELQQRPALILDAALLAGEVDGRPCSSAVARRAGRDLDVPGRAEAAANIHIGIDWLASVSFGHVTKIGKRVIVLGGGNTAMDCCRSARRLGGKDVKVIVRSGFDEMKASPWEKEDHARGHPDHQLPRAQGLVHEGGRLTGMLFRDRRAEYDDKGRRSLVPTGEPDCVLACDEVLVAVGQENAFPGSSATAASLRPVGPAGARRETHQSTVCPTCSSAATRPSAEEEHHHRGGARPRGGGVDRPLLHGEDVRSARRRTTNLMSQKMGIHEWSYDNDGQRRPRYKVPWAKAEALASIKVEVELGFDAATAFGGAALPELRRADGVHRDSLHRVRRLRRHLPDGLHHLHRQRRRGGPAHA